MPSCGDASSAGGRSVTTAAVIQCGWFSSTPLTHALGVHGCGVDVAAVLRNQVVPEPEHVAAGNGDLAPVEAGVVHVELRDQRVPAAPAGPHRSPQAPGRDEEPP